MSLPQWIENKGEDEGILEAKFNADKEEIFVWYILSIVFIVGIIALPLIIITDSLRKKWFRSIKELRDAEDIDKLAETLTTHRGTRKDVYAICALIDLEYQEINSIIKERLNEFSLKKYNISEFQFYSDLLLVLDDDEVKIKEEKKSEIDLETKNRLEEKSELPIKLAYFIKTKPKNKNCMVTKLELDFQKDIVVICPICRNYAKEKLLENWLKKNNKCPICGTDLTIDECPVVVIQNK